MLGRYAEGSQWPAIGRESRTAVFARTYLCLGWTATGSFASDIESSSQAVRDTAAEVIRETCEPPPRETWTTLLESLEPGMTMADVQVHN